MGKTRRKPSSRQRCTDLFIVVFNHLIDQHRQREKFVLSWIWNDIHAFKMLLEVILGKQNGSRDLLRNGYRACRQYEFDVFPPSTWEKIDEIFLHKRLLSDLPKPIRDFLKALKSKTQTELQALVHSNDISVGCTSTNSDTWKKVSKIPPCILEGMYGCFLGDWTEELAQMFKPADAKICRVFPPKCVFAETSGNLTYFYERTGLDVEIIAVHLKGALEGLAMAYLRSLLEELFAGHPEIIRSSMETLESHMTGFGPFWKRFELNGGSKVSFHTHEEKLSSVLKNLPRARDFEMLADIYAHTHLSELILAVYMWKLPQLVTSFFKYSKPYLGKGDYQMTDLEVGYGGYGPSAYQLYITKDLCSSIHKDVDTSEFTLSYCSHPDANSTTPVQFVMAEHGFQIGVENGCLFAFKSNVAHGTRYRNHTHNVAYMGCLVVNTALSALTKRRQHL